MRWTMTASNNVQALLSIKLVFDAETTSFNLDPCGSVRLALTNVLLMNVLKS